jgi:glucose-6-phosphate isomerase
MDSRIKQIELGSDSDLRLKMCVSADTDAQDDDELVDTRLEDIQTLFKEEADAPLSMLEQHLRAWTRSHLQTEHIQQVLDLSAKARNDFSVFVTVGIGGSDLSARVFHEIANNPYHNLLSVSERGGAPEVYFTGDTFDPIRLKALLEMLKSRNLLHKTLFNVISKSGKTGETLATLMIIQDRLQQELGSWRNQIIATTGLTTKSLLYQFHQESPLYGILPVPEGVGGRFSAFSPVGLFFLAMTAGIGEKPEDRINAAIDGVQRADKNFHYFYAHPDNAAYHLALWLDHVEKDYGASSIVFYNYADNGRLGEWFVQLYTESIQERGVGSNVIAAKGPTSNHSILNGILAGPRDKAVVFIHWEDLGADLTIPSGNEGNGLDTFEGLSMNDSQTASYRGTEMDFTEKSIPNVTLTLPSRNISNLCQLMRTLMDTVAVKGKLQELHLTDDVQMLAEELTYHQSAVEGYKQRTEEIAREMKRR